MDLTRLMRPRSVAVVGATPRTDTYAHETLRNLAALGYDGEVWGVHPTHREVLGRVVVPSLADLPAPADVVVVAIPAGVPDVIEEAGATGCGGAVVFGAGFADAGDRVLHERLVAAALRHALPVVGPNCDGMVRLHERAALWGDALRPQPPGGVALVSQSGNLAVNALATRRGLRLHTVVSCANQAVVGAEDVLAFLAEDEGVQAVALDLARVRAAGTRARRRARHVLGRGLRGRRRRGRAPRARAAAARSRDRGAAARAASEGRDGLEPARLHRSGLGRDRHPARHDRHGRRR